MLSKLYWVRDYLSTLRSRLNHVSKRGPSILLVGVTTCVIGWFEYRLEDRYKILFHSFVAISLYSYYDAYTVTITVILCLYREDEGWAFFIYIFHCSEYTSHLHLYRINHWRYVTTRMVFTCTGT